MQRTTTLTIAYETFDVTTHSGGKIRTVAQLEAAHARAVKAAITDARLADLTRQVARTPQTEAMFRRCAPRRTYEYRDAAKLAKPYPPVRYNLSADDALRRAESWDHATFDEVA